MHRAAGAYICGGRNRLAFFARRRSGRATAEAAVSCCIRPVRHADDCQQRRNAGQRSADHRARGRVVSTLGTEKSPGTKIYSVSGMVERPGNYELPLGVTMREILELAGGVRNGRKLKTFFSRAVLLRRFCCRNTWMSRLISNQPPRPVRCWVRQEWLFSTESVCLIKTAKYYADFFAHESCGQCSPSHEGTSWIKRIIDRFEAGQGTKQDMEILAGSSEQCKVRPSVCWRMLQPSLFFGARTLPGGVRSTHERQGLSDGSAG